MEVEYHGIETMVGLSAEQGHFVAGPTCRYAFFSVVSSVKII